MLIGEIAEKLKIPPDTLRYYDRIGLLSPQRQNGLRQYSEEDLQKLKAIVKMKQLLFSLEEIKTILTADAQVEKSVEAGRLDLEAAKAMLSLIRTKHQEAEAMAANIREVKGELARLAAKVEAALREDKKDE